MDDYVVAGQTTKRYDNPALYVTADEVLIDGVAPEPATAPMILAACGFAVSVVRQREAGERIGRVTRIRDVGEIQ